MIRNALLSVGLVLSTASQLRISGLPIGAGELCLALWIGLSTTRILAGGRVAATASLRRLGAFWTVLALALSVGTIVGILVEKELNIDAMKHDAMAYMLMAAVTCLAAVEPDGDQRLRQTAWLLVAFSNVGLAFQLAIGWRLLGSGTMDPWFWDRFRGWSENPNQTALYCAVIVPIAIHLAMSAKDTVGRMAGIAGAVLPLVVGRLTKSDTFLLVTVVAGVLLVGLRVRTWLGAPRRSLRYEAAIFVVLAMPLCAIALLPYAVSAADDAKGYALSLTKDKGGDATTRTAQFRLQLWDDALRKGLESGSLGLGPGPHVERPNVPNQQFLPRPIEAHNTLLDLFAQGGALAILALGWLTLSTLVLVLRARLDALAVLICSLAVFGISHFILRNPIFWFAIALCVAEGCARAPTTHVRYGR